MKINKEELKEALEIVKPGLANKELIEQSTSFAFIDGKLVTYNDSISVSHPVEGLQEINGAIQATEFYGIISKMKGTDIEIELDENEILLKSGRAKAGITLQHEVTLPLDEIEKDIKWTRLPDTFIDALTFCAPCCSKDATLPILTGVHCRPDGICEASDSYKVVRMTGDAMKEMKNCIIDSAAISHIKSIKPIAFARTGGWVHFKNIKKTEIHCRVIEDKFPNLDEQLQMNELRTIKLPETLLEALEAANVFAKRDHALDENVDLVLSKNKLTVEGKSDIGWYKEIMKVDYKETEISFSMTPSLLHDVLSKSRDMVLCTDRVKFEGENWIYMAVLKAEIV